jgi:hypothetical protein
MVPTLFRKAKMKIQGRLGKLIVILLFIAVGIAGLSVATYTFRYYPALTRGILGIIVIYLVFQSDLWPIGREPIAALFVYPTNLRYFLFALFCSIVFYWALQEIYDMVF